METVTAQTFDYLKTWDRERLYARLGKIRPTIDFLLQMHNATGDKAVSMSLYFEGSDNGEAAENLFFSNVSADERRNAFLLQASSEGFPEVLETFIHNFCTFLCAEKMMIEFLIERGGS